MYISLKWVQKIVDLKNLSFSILCDQLTLAGFEIEEIIKKSIVDEVDFILDVSLTANRSDLFNLKNFTKELLSIFFKEKKLFYTPNINNTNPNNNVITNNIIKANANFWEIFIQKQIFLENKKSTLFWKDSGACFTFLSIESNQVSVQSSPTWIQKCLLSSNVTPINNILDTINFVNLETGYPFFVYDFNKLKSYLKTSTIIFKICPALKNQQFNIDSDICVTLHPNNLILYANEKPISILGLLNLKEIEIDATTTNILIYGGLFDPVKIRKSSQSLGIRTDSSISLEKNLNFNGFEQAFIRLSFLLNVQGIFFSNNNLPNIYTINTLKKSSFVRYVENKRPILKLNYKQVTNILGSSDRLKKSDILNILEALYFRIIRTTDDYCELYVPFSREFDIEREIDLIEEVVRISGFTKFISIVPNFEKVGKFSKLEKLKRLLRKYFIEFGFNEALHYTINIPQSEHQVELKNPIVPESSYFRVNLLMQLIQKAAANRNQKNSPFEAFEIGRVYSLIGGKIVESELVSGIFGGNNYSSDWKEVGKSLNWFEAKGILESIFDRLNISLVWSNLYTFETNLLHPGRSAILTSNNQIVGIFGQIHPSIAKINSLKNETYLFEFNLEIVKSLWKEKRLYTYKAFSLFPASLIDLAFIKNNNISFKDVERKIRTIGGPLLDSIHLFDYYSGSPIPEGYHSIGFKLKFRNLEKTLTNEEVDCIVKKITKTLEKDFDINIRK